MNAWECPREADVLDAAAARRGLDRDPELAAHVAGCPICADLAVVATAMAEDHDAAWDTAEPPSSDLVWWRAQLRARTEAATAAARPMAIVQGAGLALVLIALVAIVIGYGAGVVSSLAAVTANGAALAARVLGSETAGLLLDGLVLGIAVWLALIPVAVYFAAVE
jgi:hypothetical protein